MRWIALAMQDGFLKNYFQLYEQAMDVHRGLFRIFFDKLLYSIGAEVSITY